MRQYYHAENEAHAVSMTTPEDARARGPRARVRKAVVETTREIIESQGYAALTVDAIVAASGVSKTTVYRWWTNRAEVALDVLEGVAPARPGPLRTPTRADVEALLAAELKMHRGLGGIVLRGVVGDAQRRPDLAATFDARYLAPRRRELLELLQACRSEGEIEAGTDVELVAFVLLSSLMQSVLVGHPPSTDDLPRDLVTLLLPR